MRKLLILSAFVLATVALSLQLSWSAEGGMSVKIGSFAEGEQKPALAATMGTKLVLSSDTAHGFRWTNYTGTFHANTDSTIEGFSNFTMMEKYLAIKNFEFWVGLGTGVLYKIQEDENSTNWSMIGEVGLTLYKWVGFSAGVAWITQTGEDQFFMYGGLDLINPL